MSTKQKFPILEHDLPLWTEAGRSIQEVVDGIKSRTDHECLWAWAYFEQRGLLNEGRPPIKEMIGTMAERLRDTKKIFAFFKFDALRRFVPESEFPKLIELQCLMIEAYVRMAEECFPEQN